MGFILTPTGNAKIKCKGNIENLLDYQTVANGGHPIMAIDCFRKLFSYCQSLIEAPALPATTLSESCYRDMFSGCGSLTSAPSLPATTLKNFCYDYMFAWCTSLIMLPALPSVTLTSYCYQSMFEGCTKIKLTTTRTGEYQNAYRIPTSGTGTTAYYAVRNMFYGTGGTFTSDPTINTTYYTSNTVV